LREALETLDCTREELLLRFLGLRDSEEELSTSKSPQEKIVDLFSPRQSIASRDITPRCFPSNQHSHQHSLSNKNNDV
jgi:hypothetical protein